MGLDADDVRRIAAEGEGSRVEFKRGLPRESKVARTLAAFANTRGGTLLVGVDDRGGMIGAPRPQDTAREVVRIASQFVEPPLAPTVQVLEVDGVAVVAVRVGLSDRRPHSVERGSGERELPVRIGSSTRAARGPSLDALRAGRSPRGRSGLDSFERSILDWVARQADPGTRGAGRATPQAFAKARNVGLTRARRAFVKLERDGYLVAHGERSRPTYGLP